MNCLVQSDGEVNGVEHISQLVDLSLKSIAKNDRALLKVNIG